MTGLIERHAFPALLLVLGVYVWVRDLSWLSRAGDTLPILAGIPLLFWLHPSSLFKSERNLPISVRDAAWGAGLFVAGLILNLTFLLALAWTWLLWAWLSSRIGPPQRGNSLAKLLVLPLLSFPWINTDLDSLGWFFRLSGAAAAERVFSILDYAVVREGTYLWIGEKSISVEAACSGLNGLQAMLIAGATIAYLKLKDSKVFWWNLPLLVVAAWLANSVRIILIALLWVRAEWEVANDPVHGLAGWISLCLVFGGCWFLFWLQEPKDKTQWRDPLNQPNN